MSEIEEISFRMIASVGSANALYMEAVSEAKLGKLKEARALLAEGEACFRDSHKAHAGLIMDMAGGKEIPFNMILMHAEDQLMNSEVIKLMAEQIIDLCSTVKGLEERINLLEMK